MQLPTWDQVGNWFIGGATTVAFIYVPKLMTLRRQRSTDALLRAQDSALISKSGAEADYFENAIGALTIDRDKWRDTAQQAWDLLRKAESTVARYEGLQQYHERDLQERDRQIERLWKHVLRYAPSSVKEALEDEYERTKPAPLDALPPVKGKRP